MITIKITHDNRPVETYHLAGTVLSRATGGVTDFEELEVAMRFLLSNIKLDVHVAATADADRAYKALTTNVPLGKTQQSMMRSLRDHKYYRHGGGWIWENRSVSERILDSLVRRGLVAVTMETVHPLVNKPFEARTWRLTEAGEAAIVERQPKQSVAS